ncbi:class I SAM-dependent methyltransferase [Desulfotignum balticum]|jgi:ubiquinone/menaquinone biosynthesis C-methylase UbiE|uniref:class I SAM-dependent methyltransferase n=1 Tax=Desulfotignum balticum TaxID=115781 RepID=UPI0004626C76|nr:class I SAM-dependent methyltransferase [Desulfotignum balticum]
MRKRRFSEGLFDIEPIIKELNISCGQTILDAGCGNGYMSQIFSKLVGSQGKVYALDTEKPFIDDLKKETKNTNIIPLVADITKKTELEDSSIDLVYLSTVFHIFSKGQIAGFENEIRRVCKKNAVIAILNIEKEDTPFGPPVEMRSSPEELIQKLSFSSDRLIEVDKHFYLQLFNNI